MATLITQDGDVIDNYDASTLEKMEEAVGGFVKHIKTVLDIDLCVNEQAALLGLKPNAMASALAGELVLGDVLMLNNKEAKQKANHE